MRHARRLLTGMVAVAIGVVPAWGQTLADRGVDAFLRGAFADARLLLEQAVRLQPTNPVAVRYLALAHQQLEQPQRAAAVYEDFFDRALQGGNVIAGISPVHISRVAFEYGLLAARMGDLERAERWYTHALEWDQQLSVAFLNRANARVQLSYLDEAADDYRVYLILEGDDPQRPQIERMIALLEQALAAPDAVGLTRDSQAALRAAAAEDEDADDAVVAGATAAAIAGTMDAEAAGDAAAADGAAGTAATAASAQPGGTPTDEVAAAGAAAAPEGERAGSADAGDAAPADGPTGIAATAAVAQPSGTAAGQPPETLTGAQAPTRTSASSAGGESPTSSVSSETAPRSAPAASDGSTPGAATSGQETSPATAVAEASSASPAVPQPDAAQRAEEARRREEEARRRALLNSILQSLSTATGDARNIQAGTEPVSPYSETLDIAE